MPKGTPNRLMRDGQRIPWQEVFWSRVAIVFGDGCWEWTAGRNKPGGYGHFKVVGKKKLAHRLAWECVNGPLPQELRILHKCDNPACCRPDHLQVGTQTDNIHDMESKGRGRHPRGEKCGSAKLTAAKVHAIRAMYGEGGISMEQVGERFSVGRTAVFSIVHNQTWAHTGV